jgi:hypothetical protein
MRSHDLVSNPDATHESVLTSSFISARSGSMEKEPSGDEPEWHSIQDALKTFSIAVSEAMPSFGATKAIANRNASLHSRDLGLGIGIVLFLSSNSTFRNPSSDLRPVQLV